jgi:hypothetical protein
VHFGTVFCNTIANNIFPCVCCYHVLKFTDYFLFPVPGTVISPVAFSFGKYWIKLRWGAPYPPLGELEVYKVEYKLQSSERYKIKEVSINNTCKLWDRNICFQLNAGDGINGSEVYNIKVSDAAVIS